MLIWMKWPYWIIQLDSYEWNGNEFIYVHCSVVMPVMNMLVITWCVCIIRVNFAMYVDYDFHTHLVVNEFHNMDLGSKLSTP